MIKFAYLLFAASLTLGSASNYPPTELPALEKQLSFSTAEINIGNVHILNSRGNGFVRATNTGDEAVTITDAILTGSPDIKHGFRPGLPLILQPDEGISWSFIVVPSQEGELSAQVEIISDAPDSPHVIPITATVMDVPLGPWEWEFLGKPLDNSLVSSIYIDPEDDNIWYVYGISTPVYKTTDGGNTWDVSLQAGGINSEGFVIDPANNKRLYAAARDKIYRSNDKGESWDLLEEFPAFSRSLHVSSVDGSIYFAPQWAEEENPGIYKSTDEGETWELKPFGISQTHLLPWDIEEDRSDGTLYISFEIANHPRPYNPPFLKSTDGGETWKNVFGDLPWHGTSLQIDPRNNDIYNLTEGPGLYKSVDKGENWFFLSDYFWLDLLIDNNHPQWIFGGAHTFGSDNGGAFFSPNGGQSFELTGLSELVVSSLALNHNGTELIAVSYGSGVFKTPLPDIGSTPIVQNEITDVELIAGGEDLIVDLDSTFNDADGDALDYTAWSTDTSVAIALTGSNASSLRVIPESTGEALISVAATDNKAGNAVTSFRVTIPTGVGTTESKSSSPDGFRLFQNYPNPFNVQTTIGFQLPKATHVTIKVYDQLGRQIDTIASGHFQAGVTRIHWKPENIANGVYFYEFQTEEYLEMKQVIIVQ